MRLLITLIGCCLTWASLAQGPQRSLHIKVSYEKAGQYLEQAVETIEAVNKIGVSSAVNYKAGRSVTMLPGFEARNGSTFTAEIKSVGGEENPLRLTAFPNPFEHSTTIEYYLPTDGKVNVWVTDVQGKVVGQLVQGEEQTAGKHQVEWKPQSAEAGIYIPMVEANRQKATSRVVKK
ncbi:T9SS type A sorting domain-containing protein [Spirosoma soli]|uniref:T9SS type A sorting domain-containing protein n=1 Tax=Spirosoma soli TaxID=1770529 RepID=A0ABW5M2R8_9BACT